MCCTVDGKQTAEWHSWEKGWFDAVGAHLCSEEGETKGIGSTTSCCWVCKGGGCFFLGSWARNVKPWGFTKAQEEVGTYSWACCFPALCLSPAIPNVFILLPPFAHGLLLSYLCTWGCCRWKMERQTLAQKGGKGCFGTRQGGGWGLLHKAEAILEQLPVAWKHLCDSVHWERQCKYLYKYGYYISHHLILQFLFTKPMEV